MLRRVWIDEWQMQCCGDPISLGETITLSTTPAVDRDYLEVVLGDERAAALSDYEDHHLAAGPLSSLVGVVISIDAVFCRYERRDHTMHPVAGTARVFERGEATGWEPEDEDVQFVGYIVTIRES